jgi:GTP-binding protein HflX
VEVRALIPYARGDLLDRIHKQGELLTQDHTESGTRLTARVTPSLAADLADFVE